MFGLWHINYCWLFNAKSFFIHVYLIYMISFGCVLWHINYCGLFNIKSSLYIYIHIYIWFGLVGFYHISTIVGYLMPNPLNIFILNIFDFVWSNGISTIVSYLMPNPLYTFILKIFDLVWSHVIPTIVGFLMSNPVFTNIFQMINKRILLISFLNESELFFFAHS